MILTALEMQGFKSFPEKTVLTFGKGITAVVGPNGSGKSNISDAVRWVLGEQSSKSLRGSKMEDVIFDGTKIRKAHGFAQVTLRLDNTDRSIDKDTDEVTVTRRYYRSGESEYKINGENVRLKDVHELFMDTGLGRDGYSMVSQGKIADMVSGKGRECRDMFEEAAGISAYRYKRSDSLKKLSQAEENLIRLRDILSELEGRIGPLKTQSEKAQKFLVLSEEKKNLEIGLWLYSIDKLKQDLRQQEDKIIIAKNQYQSAELELESIEKLIEQCVTNTQNINIRIDEIRQKISSLEESAARSQSEQAVLQSSIEHNNDTIERISRDRNDSELGQQQIQSEIETEEKLIAQIKKIREEKTYELNKIKDELQLMQSEGSGLDKQSADLSTNINILTKNLADFRVEASTAQSAIYEIKARVETIDLQINARQQAVDLALQDKSRADEALSKCSQEIESATNSVNGYEMKLDSLEKKADEIKRDLDEKSFEQQRTISKINMLTELEKNMEGYSGAVKKVIKQSESGSLKGIHGTLSQLISVKGEYAVAIETALGNAVQNIVTDTQQNAKAAVNFLKSTSAGRATFLPIDAVKGRDLDETGLEDCLGYVDKAVNLLSYDKKYSEIISSLLGKTVVAEDLSCAIEIAKKYNQRFKIVTLDGQLVNAGGSITGGSAAQNAGILSRSTEIEKLKEKNEALLSKIAALDEKYTELTTQIDTLNEELSGEKKVLSELSDDKIRLEGQKNLAYEQYYSAVSLLDELKGERDSADERIYAMQRDFEKATQDADKIKKEIEEYEKQLEALGTKRQEIAENREIITSKISKLNLDIHGADKDMQARNQALGLLKARLVSHEDKDKELIEEIKKIKERNEEIAKEIENLQKTSVTFAEESKKAKDEIASLQKERSTTEEKSATLRSQERTKSSERELIGGELARLEERKQTMTDEYDGTISKLYDEYQLTKREADLVGVKPEDPAASKRRLGEIKGSIRHLGSVNVGAIEEYKEVSERYEFMSSQLNDIEKSKKELIRLIDELTDKMSQQFREQFARINENFGETFKELFGGGHAELSLEDPTDVLESNIDIKLQPPGKNVKRLDSLSGGEKGLSAIALLFAIMKVNPAPFCIFDEVEAALDDVNVTRYAQYVRRMTKNTQFILITHRRGTMEEADVLYGITMQEQGVSKLLELKTAELAKKLGITQ